MSSDQHVKDLIPLREGLCYDAMLHATARCMSSFCEQYTHKCSTYRVAQLITFHHVHSKRRNLVQEYDRKFDQLSEDQTLSKLCSDAGLKLVERGQYFYTLETEEGQQMQHLCREYTMLRNEKGTRVRGWIRKNTRIGPVMNIKVCYRGEQNSVEVQVPSLFQDHTVSWIRIVNGVDRYVTESMPTAKVEDSFGETYC